MAEPENREKNPFSEHPPASGEKTKPRLDKDGVLFNGV
jgi:hypothetical protein